MSASGERSWWCMYVRSVPPLYVPGVRRIEERGRQSSEHSARSSSRRATLPRPPRPSRVRRPFRLVAALHGVTRADARAFARASRRTPPRQPTAHPLLRLRAAHIHRPDAVRGRLVVCGGKRCALPRFMRVVSVRAESSRAPGLRGELVAAEVII
ncbi:hypothetical protein B0H17DRAFT_1213397 [Mycena rosella]|uniref:Uncharacterized protein n=1 Tax=Mycena rosella TaxID=1033263 RepID=A0AAD7CQ34_MYCRO|nr:hypothetical protein B0H17DRAFT_1213397 [Mycena rosella]